MHDSGFRHRVGVWGSRGEGAHLLLHENSLRTCCCTARPENAVIPGGKGIVSESSLLMTFWSKSTLHRDDLVDRHRDDLVEFPSPGSILSTFLVG